SPDYPALLLEIRRVRPLHLRRPFLQLLLLFSLLSPVHKSKVNDRPRSPVRVRWHRETRPRLLQIRLRANTTNRGSPDSRPLRDRVPPRAAAPRFLPRIFPPLRGRDPDCSGFPASQRRKRDCLLRRPAAQQKPPPLFPARPSTSGRHLSQKPLPYTADSFWAHGRAI